MRFQEASIGSWVKISETGEVACKVQNLNGANAFVLTTRKLAYFKPCTPVEPTQPAIHPELKHVVEPSLRTLRLWGDHTWTED